MVTMLFRGGFEVIVEEAWVEFSSGEGSSPILHVKASNFWVGDKFIPLSVTSFAFSSVPLNVVNVKKDNHIVYQLNDNATYNDYMKCAEKLVIVLKKLNFIGDNR